MSIFKKGKKDNQEKLVKLVSYEKNLSAILDDRLMTLEQIDEFTIDELNNILLNVYGQKINTNNSIESVKTKVVKLLNDDVTYNKIWIKETKKKIDKLSI